MNVHVSLIHNCFQTVYKVHQDVATRWNSTYLMVERLLKLKRALAMHSIEEGTTLPNANQWSLLEGAQDLLMPFEEATNDLSSRNACASMVIPTVDLLQRNLNKVKPFGLGTMRTILA